MSEPRIIWTTPEGGVSVLIPAPGVPEERWMQDIPKDAIDVKFGTTDDLPTDRTFRNAWCPCAQNKVRIDIDKAKDICHEKRRLVRDAEFLPLDREVTIPGKVVEAEAKREQVRAKHADLQEAINQASSVEELKSIVEGL
jgi:hypothetical protein